MPQAIEVKAVSRTFVLGSRLPGRRAQRRSVEALRDVTLSVAPGEIFGLVGRNGYGKSTLIKCICSLLVPTSGSVSVMGHDSVHASQAVRRLLGYVSAEERSFYFRLTGLQNLQFFARLNGLAPRIAARRIAELSERFDVTALLPRRFHEYSTGNRQRLSLVRALLHEPTVLILDEPTRSLDPFAASNLRRALLEWVKEDRGRSVLITSHNLDEVEELSDRVGVMMRGRLAECGSLSDLRARFDDREQIRLWLSERTDIASLREALRRTNLEVEISEDMRRGPNLTFRRRARDTSLDQVLCCVADAGAQVLSFDRTEMSLQDIIDQVDAEQAP